MTNEDPRVIKTRLALKQTLYEMLETIDYNSITVREIAKQAGIGFRTFYRHYNDKDDLMLAIVEDLVSEFAQNRPPIQSLADAEQTTVIFLHFIAQKGSRFYLMLKTGNREQVFQAVEKFGAEEGKMLYHASLAKGEAGHTIPLEIVGFHFISSILSLVKWWIDHDMIYSVDEMAEYINGTVVRPFWHLHKLEAEHKAQKRRDL